MDAAAFSAAYAEFRPRLFAFLLRLVRNRAVAEELLQDCFVKLAVHAPKLRADTVLGAWLFTVARNAATSHHRWAAFDLSRVLVTPRTLTPEEEAASNEGERKLDKALAQMSFGDREIILLSMELSPRQMAAALKLPDATLRQRLSRARTRLDALLEKP